MKTGGRLDRPCFPRRHQSMPVPFFSLLEPTNVQDNAAGIKRRRAKRANSADSGSRSSFCSSAYLRLMGDRHPSRQPQSYPVVRGRTTSLAIRPDIRPRMDANERESEHGKIRLLNCEDHASESSEERSAAREGAKPRRDSGEHSNAVAGKRVNEAMSR